MILMGKNPFWGPLEGMGPENRDFFGPWNGNERGECHLVPKKSRLKDPCGGGGGGGGQYNMYKSIILIKFISRSKNWNQKCLVVFEAYVLCSVNKLLRI